MKRLIPLTLLAPALLAIAAPAIARERGPHLRPSANPSAVIARELEFAQAAKDNGQWTAFRDFAAPDAVMFVPGMVYAQDWLKDRPNPATAVTWQPAEVWSSCDGSIVVSSGAWQGTKAIGYFTTIWQRQADGQYKWVLDHGDTLQEAQAVPEMIPAHVADCPARKAAAPRPTAPARKGRKAALAPLDPAHRAGSSDDGSIAWEVTVTPEGARNLSIEWTHDGTREPLLIEEVAAVQP